MGTPLPTNLRISRMTIRVIRCLTIPIQDVVTLNIALELIMPGRPPRHLHVGTKRLTAFAFGPETL